MKEWRKIFHANGRHKRAGVKPRSAALQADSPSEPPGKPPAILTSDKIDFNSKAVTRA